MSNARELAELGGSYGTGGFVGMKNRIINGAMVIDQRNAGASVTPTTSAYTVDRWQYQTSVASKITVQQNAGGLTGTNLPTGFKNYLGFTTAVVASPAASDVYEFCQKIEGFNCFDFNWGTSTASAVTVSFWVRSSLTGTHSGSITNNAGNRSYPFTFTVSSANTWEQKSITIAGDTSGTWMAADNTSGMVLYFNLGTGTTYTSTANSWQAGNYVGVTGAVQVVANSGATFYITGVQLEKGSTATSFDYRPYGTELALCQRYLPAFTGSGNMFGFGLAGSTTTFFCTAAFPVPARVPPTGITVSAVGDFNGTDVYAQNAACTSIAYSGAGTSFGYLNCAVGSGLTANRPTTLLSNSANSKLLFTGCEL